MKCYVHQTIDAVGVCHECGQGVCDACAVRIGGKLYCKTDADNVFGGLQREKEEIDEIGVAPSQRLLRVSVSSILFYIYGLIGIGLSFLFILAGFAVGAVGDLAPSTFASTSIGILVLGGILLLMGIIGVICGWWLWNNRLLGAVVGIPLLAAGIIIVTTLAAQFPTLSSGEIAGTVWVGNISMTILLFFSWHKLKQ